MILINILEHAPYFCQKKSRSHSASLLFVKARRLKDRPIKDVTPDCPGCPAKRQMLAFMTVDGEAVVFLHIPKTAGTTLNRIIESQYSAFSIYSIDPFRIRATAERLKQLPERRRRHLRVVRGHLFYGIHKFLPQGATYITMLRDPVPRLLSTYYFILRRPLHPMHRKLQKERVGVEDFIRLTPHRQNLQCRFIAGIGNGEVCDERVLDIAKENLARSFSVIGLCERFEESLMLMAKRFGWEVPFYKNRKVSKSHPMVEPELVDFIREHNRLDVELYEFGKKLFEQRLCENEEAVKEGLATLRAIRRPGILEGFCQSSVRAGRFLLNKIASAI
jgi:Galactose-3-O-sulfotransferase